MATYKIVHYINQFFAGIGGEEKADIVPEVFLTVFKTIKKALTFMTK